MAISENPDQQDSLVDNKVNSGNVWKVLGKHFTAQGEKVEVIDDVLKQIVEYEDKVLHITMDVPVEGVIDYYETSLKDNGFDIKYLDSLTVKKVNTRNIAGVIRHALQEVDFGLIIIDAKSQFNENTIEAHEFKHTVSNTLKENKGIKVWLLVEPQIIFHNPPATLPDKPAFIKFSNKN